MNELFGPIVHSYTRADAIADGVLVDLTASYPEECRLYRYPVDNRKCR
jgi:type I site-specific restriction endonuclease